MKKIIYLSVIGFFIISCSSSGNDSEPANVAPTVPTLVAPTNNKLCIDNSVSFQWNLSTDANNDGITYQIQVAKDKGFSQIVKTVEGSTNTQNISLEKGVAYYWRVKATDVAKLSSDYSVTYNFYTAAEAVINHLPFSPDLMAPALNTALNLGTTTLKWTAVDVDATDKLVYDVYFGTVNPPATKVSENLTTNVFEVTVVASKEYYWKVVVKDNKGGETTGQIWKFKTN
jgi:hypothetical protein